MKRLLKSVHRLFTTCFVGILLTGCYFPEHSNYIPQYNDGPPRPVQPYVRHVVNVDFHANVKEVTKESFQVKYGLILNNRRYDSRDYDARFRFGKGGVCCFVSFDDLGVQWVGDYGEQHDAVIKVNELMIANAAWQELKAESYFRDLNVSMTMQRLTVDFSFYIRTKNGVEEIQYNLYTKELEGDA